MPKYEPGATYFDIFAMTDGSPTYISQRSSMVIGTGLEFEVPTGYAVLIFPRAGMSFKLDVRLSNGVSVVDNTTRGEVVVKLRCDGNVGVQIHTGDRIAQAVLLPVPVAELIEVEEF